MYKVSCDYKMKFNKINAWGIITCLDIHNCDPQLIRNPEVIKDFVLNLCDLIGMKMYGDPVIVNFGNDERVSGYSMTQLIETSLISAHFANQSNNVYLDIFSCKYYDPEIAATFAKDFFKGKDYNINVVFRK